MPALMRRINIISRCCGLYRTERLQNDELTATHHNFILAICKNPEMSQEQIARHLCLNKSTVTRALNQLEANGYVTRKPSESDRRVTLVSPTEKAQAVFPEVRRITREWNERLVEDIPADKLEVFFEVLSQMEERAKAMTQPENGGKAP